MDISERLNQLKTCSKIAPSEREDFIQFCAEYLLSQKTVEIPTRYLVAEYYRAYYTRKKPGEELPFKQVHLEPEVFEKFLGLEDKTHRSFEKRQARSQFMREVKLLLRPVEYKVLLQFLDGITYIEIGRRMGVSESRISQHIASITKKLRANEDIAMLLR